MSSKTRIFAQCTPEMPSVTVTGDAVHHLFDVLRLKAGDELTVCDGHGTDYDGIVTVADKSSFTVSISSPRRSVSEASLNITLFQGMPKSDKLEYIVQKSTELGVCTVVPVVCDRSVSRPDNKSMSKKLERLNKIAMSAAMQSGRGIVPEVKRDMDFCAAVALMKSHGLCFACHEDAGSATIGGVCGSINDLESVAFFIGPEGGISERETKILRESGVPLVTLGKRILRTETAPLYVLSVLDSLVM